MLTRKAGCGTGVDTGVATGEAEVVAERQLCPAEEYVSGGGAMPKASRMAALACAVPFAPQEGHLTACGMWPSTGSTSKAYFIPHPQMTLISIGVLRVRQSGSSALPARIFNY